MEAHRRWFVRTEQPLLVSVPVRSVLLSVTSIAPGPGRPLKTGGPEGFGSIDEIRGMFAAAVNTSQPDFGRVGYLSAIERVTRTYAPR